MVLLRKREIIQAIKLRLDVRPLNQFGPARSDVNGKGPKLEHAHARESTKDIKDV